MAINLFSLRHSLPGVESCEYVELNFFLVTDWLKQLVNVDIHIFYFTEILLKIESIKYIICFILFSDLWFFLWSLKTSRVFNHFWFNCLPLYLGLPLCNWPCNILERHVVSHHLNQRSFEFRMIATFILRNALLLAKFDKSCLFTIFERRYLKYVSILWSKLLIDAF